ncbi:hypothetical protein NDU88_003387 [Pleurodeles waltl]|uniref:Endonuclease/exonuclease/phosphatase domain-containing protein n=1 Tax=Pleurodeles waltl TaxID=8319 RepID=A0AAV7NGI6_PLEWA|nr:hypothetical protein NDU88_003387 [Pleurodeles waltl]
MIGTQALASSDYILLGDLNFHLENAYDSNSTALIANLANLGLKQLVTTLTHSAGHTLDPVFSASSHVSFSHATELHLPDHHCVHFTFEKPTAHHRPQQIPRCSWNKISEDQLISTLAWAPPPSTTDPNTAALNLRQWLDDCTNTLALLKKSPNNHTSAKVIWFTTDLQSSKQECRKIEEKWCHKPTESNLAALKTATRKHHQLIRTTKRSFYKDRINNNAHNSKELFSIFKELTNPRSCTIDPPPSQDLCDSLATFFHRNITEIHESFNSSSPITTKTTTIPDIPSHTNLLLSWTQISDEDTIKTMSTIHSGSPSEPCPHHVFNKVNPIIAPQLFMIINSSFETATFPESWKHAEVNALLKKPKADPEDLKNYRPISLLPFPAKVIEKIVNGQLP